jgi:transcription initiation factor IIF auxiliary subunit
MIIYRHHFFYDECVQLLLETIEYDEEEYQHYYHHHQQQQNYHNDNNNNDIINNAGTTNMKTTRRMKNHNTYGTTKTMKGTANTNSMHSGYDPTELIRTNRRTIVDALYSAADIYLQRGKDEDAKVRYRKASTLS